MRKFFGRGRIEINKAGVKRFKTERPKASFFFYCLNQRLQSETVYVSSTLEDITIEPVVERETIRDSDPQTSSILQHTIDFTDCILKILEMLENMITNDHMKTVILQGKGR